MRKNVLVSDFDGTITQRDFYSLIAERYMPADAPDYFAQYRSGQILHWEAMQGFFHHAPEDEAALAELLRETRPDPALRSAVERLGEADWDVIVVSAGSSWYIDRIFAEAGVDVVVHSNPGEIVAGHGLVLSLPRDSRFFSPEVGVDKAGVVRDALERYEAVAFAGDGPPDLEPALLVDPELRFARSFLAEELARRSERYRAFAWWGEVAELLLKP